MCGLKKLLIISYYWPPAGGPGVQRWVKLTKYLTKLGYDCHVVTVHEEYASYPSVDLSLQKDVAAGIKVTKTRSFEVLKIFTSLFKKEKVPYAGIPEKNKMSAVGRMALYVRSNFFIPDARIGWNNYALKACRQIIQKEKIDAIITTSPPHSTQLIGIRLKEEFPRLKWLADLRDPWTDIYFYSKLSHTGRAKAKDLALEKSVIDRCDAITTVSADLKRLFAAKSGNAAADKINILANGFDEDDFNSATGQPNEKFTLIHTGTINSNYNLNGFINAFLKFISDKKEVTLKFVGNTDPLIKEQLTSALGSICEFIDYLPHSEITKVMQGGDCLLLAIPDNPQNKGILTGKLFEYLAARKPILGLGPPDGDAAAIITECNAGHMFDFNETEKISSCLNGLYTSWKTDHSTHLEGKAYLKYSRKELAAQVASIIEKMR